MKQSTPKPTKRRVQPTKRSFQTAKRRFQTAKRRVPGAKRRFQTAKRSLADANPLHVPKAWGSELWIHNGPDYTFKILAFLARSSGSMHYHLRKTETWYVESGRFVCVQADPQTGRHVSRPLRHGDVVHLPAGTAHQLRCLENGRIFEASTPHDDDDTYRVSPSEPPYSVVTCKDFTDIIMRRTEQLAPQILKDLAP